MKTIIPKSNRAPFREEWAACLAKAPRNARIATLPDLAFARSTAPHPHTPGKPWETYYDGTSPLWENWFMTSSCLLLGLRDDRPAIAIVHGLDPAPSRDETNGKYFRFPTETWARALAQADGSWSIQSGLAAACRPARRDDGLYAATELTASPFFRAAFAAPLDAYADVHREIASQYLVCKLKYADRFANVPAECRPTLTDPPILELDIGWARREEPPTRGALGRYFCLTNVLNMHLSDLAPSGMTRQCELDTVGPKDDSHFLAVLD